MKLKTVMWLAVLLILGVIVPQAGFTDQQLTELFTAVEAGDMLTVKQILDADIVIDARNTDGLTPLMAAARANQPEIAGELLSRGADVNARIGFYGITALTLAMRHGRDSEIVQLLILSGAREDVQDDRGRIPVIVTELE